MKKISTKFLSNVVDNISTDKISMKDLLANLHSDSFGVIIMFFSFAVIIPFPPPIPSIFSVPLLFFSSQMFFGLKVPRLPSIFFKISIKRYTLARILEKSSRILARVEKIIKARLLFLSSNSISKRLIGLIIFIFSIFITIPLPFTNFLPAIGILLISLGMIEKDGVLIISGTIVGIIGVTVAINILLLSGKILNLVKESLFYIF